MEREDSVYKAKLAEQAERYEGLLSSGKCCIDMFHLRHLCIFQSSRINLCHFFRTALANNLKWFMYLKISWLINIVSFFDIICDVLTRVVGFITWPPNHYAPLLLHSAGWLIICRSSMQRSRHKCFIQYFLGCRKFLQCSFSFFCARLPALL